MIDMTPQEMQLAMEDALAAITYVWTTQRGGAPGVGQFHLDAPAAHTWHAVLVLVIQILDRYREIGGDPVALLRELGEQVSRAAPHG